MYNYKYRFIFIGRGVNLKIEMNIEPAKAVKVSIKRLSVTKQIHNRPVL